MQHIEIFADVAIFFVTLLRFGVFHGRSPRSWKTFVLPPSTPGTVTFFLIRSKLWSHLIMKYWTILSLLRALVLICTENLALKILIYIIIKMFFIIWLYLIWMHHWIINWSDNNYLSIANLVLEALKHCYMSNKNQCIKLNQ